MFWIGDSGYLVGCWVVWLFWVVWLVFWPGLPGWVVVEVVSSVVGWVGIIPAVKLPVFSTVFHFNKVLLFPTIKIWA